jgi:hypothetical protein
MFTFGARIVPLLLGFSMLLTANEALAEPRPAPDADAVALFDEGRHLMAESKFAEAIPKFEESLRHARSVGALLNLGRCYEEAGRMASAWATYRAAAALARELHDAREEAADRFAAAVRPKVSTLTIDARALAGIDGALVKRVGVVVGPGAYGDASPIDAGEHVVEATAPGKKRWIGRVTVARGDAAVIAIARLEDAPVAARASIDAPVAESGSDALPPPSSTQRTIGYVGIGVGVAGLATGALAGLFALTKHKDATTACPTYPEHCPSDGSADAANDASRTWATVSTIAFIAGGAATALGVALVVTSPRAHGKEAAVRVVPVVTARGAGLGAVASW